MGEFDDDPEIRPQCHTFLDDPVTGSELDPLRQIVVDALSLRCAAKTGSLHARLRRLAK